MTAILSSRGRWVSAQWHLSLSSNNSWPTADDKKNERSNSRLEYQQYTVEPGEGVGVGDDV